MIKLGMLRECYTYNDWGREKVLALAAPLTDEQLDRSFEMGEGSLRKTIYHIWAAEFSWLNRWERQPASGYDPECHGESLAELKRRLGETAQRRNAYLARLDDAGLTRTVTYTNDKGITSTFSVGDMMLHVCDHGVHHRAQAANMLRHLGIELPKPGIDYILMRLFEPGAPPALDVESLRAYFAYADWARDQVHAAVGRLTDEQLDRPFELGSGTIRSSLLHIRNAEHWWFENWTLASEHHFPSDEEPLPVAEIVRLFRETAARRDDLLHGLSDADLSRIVSATPRPGITRTFPLGVTMLQLCCHGSHHRAQVLNMLRHVGADVPALGYVAMLRSR